MQSAILSLKQVWIDKVDIVKGNSSVKAMAFQGGFQTLLHAFLAAKDEKDVDAMDLNNVVKLPSITPVQIVQIDHLGHHIRSKCW